MRWRRELGLTLTSTPMLQRGASTRTSGASVDEFKPLDRSPSGMVRYWKWWIGAALSATFDFLLYAIAAAIYARPSGMANIWGDQFQQTKVRGLWTAFIDVQFNGAGTPTLVQATYINNSSNVTWATAGAKGTKWGALT